MSKKHRISGRKQGWVSSEKAHREAVSFLEKRNLNIPSNIEIVDIDEKNYIAVIGHFVRRGNMIKCALGKFERLYTLHNNGSIKLIPEDVKYKILAERHRRDMLKKFGRE